MIKLYHYSDKDFRGYIKPKFFGENSYSKNSLKNSGVDLSYFYLSQKGREIFFVSSKFLYTAEISRKKLYDLIKDKLKLEDYCYNRNKDIFTEIKKRGFSGIIGNNGFKAVVLFYPVKIKEKFSIDRAGNL